jgi:hypothetical protein
MRKQTAKLTLFSLLTAFTLSGCGELNQLTEATEEVIDADSKATEADKPKSVASVLGGPLTLANEDGRTTVPNGGLFVVTTRTGPTPLNIGSTAFDVRHVASHKDGVLTYNESADWTGLTPVVSPSEILCFDKDSEEQVEDVAIFKMFVLGDDDTSVTSLSPSNSPGSLTLQPTPADAGGASDEALGEAAVLVSTKDQVITITCPRGDDEGESAGATELRVREGINVIVGEEPSDRTKPIEWRVARDSDELKWKYTPNNEETPEQDPGPAWLSLPAQDGDSDQNLTLGTYDLLRQAVSESGYSTVKVGTLTVETGDMTVELEPAVAQAQRSGLQANNLCPNDTSGVQIAYEGPTISLAVRTPGEADNLARIVSSAPENASGGLSLVHANSATSGAVTLECEVKVNDELRIRRWSEVTLNEGWNLLRYARSGDSQESTPVDIWTNAALQGIDLMWELEPFGAPPN